LARNIGAGEPTHTILTLLHKATAGNRKWQPPLMKGLAAGLKNRETLPKGIKKSSSLLVNACLKNPEVSVRKSAREMLTHIGFPGGSTGNFLTSNAKSIAENTNISSEKRAEAIHLLAAINPRKELALFKQLANPNKSSGVQIAAIQGMGAIPDTTVSSFILKNWTGFSPQTQDFALNTFLKEPFNIPRIKILLRALRKGQINKSALGWSRSVILMRDIPDNLKEQARDLLANQNDDRDLVIKNYKEALQLKGDPEKGLAVYQQNCLICHRIHGEMGVDFGPDLGTVQRWTPESILINILAPNKSIANGYELWNITQKDGTTLQGIITSETPNAIVLRSQTGQETTIAQRNVAQKKLLQGSPMPSDFEKKIDKQQMADLIAFIKKGGK